jgi:hypothetical protein
MPFVHIQCRDEIRTPCRLELVKAWRAQCIPLPDCLADTTQILARAVLVDVAKTIGQSCCLLLDKVVEAILPPELAPKPGEVVWTPEADVQLDGTLVPRPHFKDGATFNDIVCPEHDRRICSWANSVLSDHAHFVTHGRCDTKALVLHGREGTARFVWDLRGRRPKRIAYRTPAHEVSLSPLLEAGLLEGFADINIVHVMDTSGASLGSRTPPVFIAHPAAVSFMLNRKVSNDDLLTEIESGCVDRIDVASATSKAVAVADGGRGCGIPFWPLRCEQNATIPKKCLTPGTPIKWRRITNKKIGPLATNDAVFTAEFASQQYSSIDDVRSVSSSSSWSSPSASTCPS